MKAKICALFSLLFLLGSCIENPPSDKQTSSEKPTATETNYIRKTYQNPLKFYKQDGSEYFVTCADPDVIKGEDGYFYMYCTNTYCEMGDKGMQYDRGPIFQSKDLINWKWIASAFENSPNALDWGKKEAGVWAPTVLKVGDHYCYYYSLSILNDDNPGIGVAISPAPYGPFRHYGKILDSTTSGIRNSIDPVAHYDSDGKLYLIWGFFFGIGAVELTDDGTEVFYGMDNMKDHVKHLIKNTSGDKMNLDVNYEGSYIIEKDNNYYYLGSQGTCLSGTDSTYRVKVGKSDSLFGPYYGSDNKALDDLDGSFGDLVVGPSDDVAGTGHNSVIQDYNGDYYLIYHGYDKEGEYPTERTLFMDKLLWDENDMPYVENRSASIRKDKVGPLTIDF